MLIMRSSSFLILSLSLHALAITAIAMAPQHDFLKASGHSEVQVSVDPAPSEPSKTQQKTIEPTPPAIPAAATPPAPVKPAQAPKPKASVAALLKRKVEATPTTAASSEPVTESTETTETAETAEATATETPAPTEEQTGVGDGGVEATPDNTQGEVAGATKDEAVSYLGLKQVEGNKGPSYPESARRENRQGNLELVYRVTKEGKVAEISVAKSSGHSDLDQAAVQAISQFKFIPGQEGWARHPVTFSLKGPDVSKTSELQ